MSKWDGILGIVWDGVHLVAGDHCGNASDRLSSLQRTGEILPELRIEPRVCPTSCDELFGVSEPKTGALITLG